MPFPFTGQFAIMLVSQPRRFQKSPPGAEGKSAGTVRSRRMKFCEKGVGGGSHQQAKTAFWRSRRKAVLSLCGNKDTACYNGDTPKTGEDDRPMQRPIPKLQWEGTGLTRHCLSYSRSFWQTVSQPSHCGVRFAQVEKRTTPHTRVTKQAESVVGSGGRRLKPFLIWEVCK